MKYILSKTCYGVDTMIFNRNIHILCKRKFTCDEIELLSYGCKYIPPPDIYYDTKSKNIMYKDIDDMCNKLERNMQLKNKFKDNSNQHIPALNIPNPNYQIDTPNININKYMTACKNDIYTETEYIYNKYKDNDKFNEKQRKQKKKLFKLNKLCKDKDIIILIADKNLGFVILDRQWYINELKRQLCGNNTYKHITQDKNEYLKRKLYVYERELKILIESININFGESDARYLTKSLELFKKNNENEIYIPHIKLLPKIHKTLIISYLKARPVIPNHSTMISFLSKWIDNILKQYINKCRHVLKDTKSLINKINDIDIMKSDIMFTMDVTSLYTNIPNEKGLEVLRCFLSYRCRLPKCMIDDIIDAMRLILKYNIFESILGIFRQLIGVAMGTQCAPTYAIIFVAYHEDEMVCSFDCLIYFSRYIDDCFGIWRGDMNDLLSFCKQYEDKLGIEMTCEFSVDRIVMLDLVIYKEYNNSRLQYTTHIKKTNLHQYILPTSFHPKHHLKALIIGQLKRFAITNSTYSNYMHHRNLLFEQIRNRGHHVDKLLPLFQSFKYDERQSILCNNNVNNNNDNNKIFMIAKYNNINKCINYKNIFKKHYNIIDEADLSDIIPIPTTAYTNPPNVKYYVRKYTKLNKLY